MPQDNVFANHVADGRKGRLGSDGTLFSAIIVQTVALTPAQVNTVTAPEQTFNTFTSLDAGDIVLSVTKAAHQAGLAIGQCRVTANDTLGIVFINPTAGNITPTAGENYTVVALRP